MRIGTTVLYVLSESDVALITAQRTTQESIKNRAQRNPPEWPAGAVAHVGDPVQAGDLVPLLVTRETPTGEMLSGQAFLNGSDTFWVAAAEFIADDVPKPGQATTISHQMGLEIHEAIADDRKKARLAR